MRIVIYLGIVMAILWVLHVLSNPTFDELESTVGWTERAVIERDSAMNEEDMEMLVKKERERVTSYLIRQGIDDPNVGEWPAFEMAPNFYIWAIESEKAKGKIGWWAFSGDIPTDYVTEDGGSHPRNALRIMLMEWGSHIPAMRSGKNPENVNFGKPSDLPKMADLLETRVKYLKKVYKNDDYWDDK